MLKKAQSRLLPESMAKQQWRIHSCRQNRSSDCLGQVVQRSELFGGYLQVHLKTGVTRFHHDVVMGHLQFVQTLDVDGEGAAPQSRYGRAKLLIARQRRDVAQT